jgi:hypothetical protein
MRTLEERVLRVLYEGQCSAAECAAELQRYEGGHDRLLVEIGALLADLASRSLVEVRSSRCGTGYALGPEGSRHLADLAEAGDRAQGVA